MVKEEAAEQKVVGKAMTRNEGREIVGIKAMKSSDAHETAVVLALLGREPVAGGELEI